MPLARTNAILPLVAASDLTGMVGRFVIRIGDSVALATDPAVKPFGVLLTDGPAGQPVSVAVGAGGLAGTVRVKLGAAVTLTGTFLQLADNGTVVPENPANPARCVCAFALETGAINELIEAVIFNPVTPSVSSIPSFGTPYDLGNISGTVTLNPANGPQQYAAATGNVTLAPLSGSSRASVQLRITANGADRLLTLDAAIEIPSEASVTFPKTLLSGKTYVLLLARGATKTALLSIVGGMTD